MPKIDDTKDHEAMEGEDGVGNCSILAVTRTVHSRRTGTNRLLAQAPQVGAEVESRTVYLCQNSLSLFHVRHSMDP